MLKKLLIIISLLFPVIVFGQSGSTQLLLNPWVSTTSPATAITQRVFGTSLRLTGYAAGCIQASANGTLSSTGSACGSGGGGASIGEAWQLYSSKAWLAPTTTVGIIVNSSSTISALTVLNGTTTNATSTNLYVSGDTRLASLSGILKASTGIVSTASNGTDYTLIIGLTCTAGNHVSAIDAFGNVTCSADTGGSGNWATTSQDYYTSVFRDWSLQGSPLYLAPTTSRSILINNSTSTITNLLVVNGTTTNATSTNLVVTDRLETSLLHAYTSSGLVHEAANGTDIAVLGAGNSANSLFYGGVNIDGATRLATSLNGLLTTTAGAVTNAIAGTDYISPAFSNWSLQGSPLYLAPTTSRSVLINNATSTITNLVVVNGTTTNATSTYLSVATEANIPKLSNLTTTGFVKSTTGTLSVDTNTYLTGNQTITLSGVVQGSGTTGITTSYSGVDPRAFNVVNGYLTPTTTTWGLLVNHASSTITNLTVVNGTTTNSTSTNSVISNQFKLSALSDGCLTVTSSLVSSTGVACGVAAGSWATTSQDYYNSQFRDWSVQGNGYLAPSTTRSIIVNASSTIGSGATAGGLTVNGAATTTDNLIVQGNKILLSVAGNVAYFSTPDATVAGNSTNQLNIFTGTASTSGAGGDINIYGGDGGNNNASGGNIYIYGGNASGNGLPGHVTLGNPGHVGIQKIGAASEATLMASNLSATRYLLFPDLSGTFLLATGTQNFILGNGTTTNATTTYLSVTTEANIPKLSNLTTTGFVKSTTGTLSVDTSTYLTANQTITLSGVVQGSGTTGITTSYSGVDPRGWNVVSGALTPTTTTYGILVNNASSTITNLVVVNGTTTNSTSTNKVVTGDFWLNSERWTDLTGTGLSNSSGVLTNSGVISASCTGAICSGTNPLSITVDGSSTFRDWKIDANGYLIPTTTRSILIQGQTNNIGLGTTSPWGYVSIGNSTGNNEPLFVVASSSAVATTTNFIIDVNGKVGIATTTPSPNFELNVHGKSYHSSDTFLGATTSATTSEGYVGRISPWKYLAFKTGTTTTWTATTSGVYVDTKVAPYSGTIRDISCFASSTNAFLGVNLFIGTTPATPSYFVASNTVGVITFTGNNTFTRGQTVGINVGTTTTDSNAKLLTCTARVTETP